MVHNCGVENTILVWSSSFWNRRYLTFESVKSASLSLEGIENVHGSASLSMSVLGVGDSVTDDVFKEPSTHRGSPPLMRLTPPLRTRSRIAGLVMTWMLSLKTFLCLFSPLLPITFSSFSASHCYSYSLLDTEAHLTTSWQKILKTAKKIFWKRDENLCIFCASIHIVINN
jgi:hypothetical protein